ncbi:alpha/beta hydrolase [Streptomyces sasae]|uniref:alpha/beta hydrolase n=1 Tax=Streptomyces sasae TaxID=1266772 RepID=UPI00292DB69C|nr:alpha/beta hydrolase [Streptomyces sasae]
MSGSGKPTVALVHGAFADASSHARVIPDLLADGVGAVAAALPDRSLLGDAACIASLVRAIPGPVVLVGHSYGGAVITVAGAEDDARALICLAGFALAEGESLNDMLSRSLDPRLASALVPWSFPVEGSATPGTELTVAVDRFPALVAADADPDAAAVLAVSQRPVAAAAFSGNAPVAAWRTKPSWGMVAAADLDPEAERFGCERAGMTVVEADSSHLVMPAQPERVVELIREAVRATAEVG